MTAAPLSDSVGVVAPQSAVFDAPFATADGGVLPSLTIAYETYGVLNPQKSNAVLVCHALSGSHHAAGYHAGDAKSAGWWEAMIGPGKPIDTNKFFVVSANNPGGCHGSTGPASIDSQTGAPFGSRFPKITVEDWVRAQRLLARRLSIGRFAAIVGGSLGGMQALRWAIDYPDEVCAIALIAAAARLSTFNIAFNDIARQAILGDPNFCGGEYYDREEKPHVGLGVARMLGHVTYLSDAAMAAKFGRERRASAQTGYGVEFEVESYLRYQGEKFSRAFDANTYLLMTRALDYFDPAAEQGGDLARALAPVKARTLVVSFASDWRFPPARSREIVRALLANRAEVSYAEIDSALAGHDSFLLPNVDYQGALAAFLDSVYRGLDAARTRQ